MSDITPEITNLNMSGDRSSFTLTGTGAANQVYVLLTASNLPPLAWLPVLTNTADNNGAFSFTDLQVSTTPSGSTASARRSALFNAHLP